MRSLSSILSSRASSPWASCFVVLATVVSSNMTKCNICEWISNFNMLNAFFDLTWLNIIGNYSQGSVSKRLQRLTSSQRLLRDLLQALIQELSGKTCNRNSRRMMLLKWWVDIPYVLLKWCWDSDNKVHMSSRIFFLNTCNLEKKSKLVTL